MGSLFRFPLDQLPFVLLVTVIAFTIHEFAHAYAADKFGDPTPRAMGRVTLNPRVHLDILGTILIFIAGFGWAKPVVIQPGFFKKPRLMSIVVSVVGPLSNLVMAFFGVFLVYVLYELGVFDHVSLGVSRAISLFLQLLIFLNLVLFLFNLLPLPPLDGYRILYEIVPVNARPALQKYEQWSIFIFLLMLFVPPLYHATIGRIFALTFPILSLFNSFFAMIFGNYGQLGLIF